MKRLLLALTLAVSVLAGLVLTTAPPALAELNALRWQTRTVCVEDHTGTSWPVTTATTRFDQTPELRYLYRADCAGYSQVVRVYEGSYGRTGWFSWTDCHIRRAVDRRIWRDDCTTRLNRTYLPRLPWNARVGVILHELGHTAGLNHTSRYRSVMNVATQTRWSYLQAYDLAELDRAYL